MAFLSLCLAKEPVKEKDEKQTCKKVCRLLKKAIKTTFSSRELLLGYLSWAICFNDISISAFYNMNWLLGVLEHDEALDLV